MKVSEITLIDVIAFLRCETEDFGNEKEKRQLNMMLAAAKKYVKSYTALSDKELDENEDITMAVLILCQDFYDNRSRNLMNNESAVNKTLEALLGFHDHNLLY